MEPKVKALKIKLKKQRIKGLALDIDETLAFTGGYWIEKIEEKFGANPEKLTARQIIDKYTVAQDAPYWQSQEVLDWMEKARDDKQIYSQVPLLENANYFVNKLSNLAPVVAYITIRPRGVEEVTRKWLGKHGFPKAEILTRPQKTDYERGTKWKAQVLDFLYPEVLGIVDDNRVILDFLPKSYKGYVFIFGRSIKHKGNINVTSCKTWEDVLVNVADQLPKNNA